VVPAIRMGVFAPPLFPSGSLDTEQAQASVTRVLPLMDVAATENRLWQALGHRGADHDR
jgi:hypothetical protein